MSKDRSVTTRARIADILTGLTAAATAVAALVAILDAFNTTAPTGWAAALLIVPALAWVIASASGAAATRFAQSEAALVAAMAALARVASEVARQADLPVSRLTLDVYRYENKLLGKPKMVRVVRVGVDPLSGTPPVRVVQGAVQNARVEAVYTERPKDGRSVGMTTRDDDKMFLSVPTRDAEGAVTGVVVLTMRGAPRTVLETTPGIRQILLSTAVILRAV